MGLSKQAPREQMIIDMVAFLGRYGKQPADVVMRMPITFALRLMTAVAQLVKDEQPEER